jgi:hypothetical protein
VGERTPLDVLRAPSKLVGRAAITEFNELAMTDLPVPFTSQRKPHRDYRAVHVTEHSKGLS